MDKRNSYNKKDAIHKAKCCAYCIHYSRRTVIDGYCDKYLGSIIERTYTCNLFIGIGELCKISTHSPCPKCGSRRLYVPSLDEWEVYYRVHCRDCMFMGPQEISKKRAWEAYDKEWSHKTWREI